MTPLCRRTLVRCPEIDAAEALEGYFRGSADASGQVRLALRSAVLLPRLKTEIALQRDVMVTLRTPGFGGSTGDGAYGVDWLPADGGSFPRLTGKLTVLDEPDRSGFMLVFDGRYRSALTLPGHSCGRRLAHRIAQAIARDLLLHVRDQIEGAHRGGAGHLMAAALAETRR